MALHFAVGEKHQQWRKRSNPPVSFGQSAITIGVSQKTIGWGSNTCAGLFITFGSGMWSLAVAIRTIAGLGFRWVVSMPGFAGGCKSSVAEGYRPCSVGITLLAAGKTGVGEGNRAGAPPLHTGSEAKDREHLSLHCNSSAYEGCNAAKYSRSVGFGWVPPPFRYPPHK